MKQGRPPSHRHDDVETCVSATQSLPPIPVNTHTIAWCYTRLEQWASFSTRIHRISPVKISWSTLSSNHTFVINLSNLCHSLHWMQSLIICIIYINCQKLNNAMVI